MALSVSCVVWRIETKYFVRIFYLYAQENIFGNEIENMPRFSKVNCIDTFM